MITYVTIMLVLAVVLFLTVYKLISHDSSGVAIIISSAAIALQFVLSFYMFCHLHNWP